MTLLAAIVGEYIRWRLMQPKLVVSVTLGDIGRTGDGGIAVVPTNNKPSIVFLEARNPRIHPVTVTSFGFEVRNGKNSRMQVGHQSGFTFPYEIAGGKSLVQWLNTKVLLESLAESGNKPSDIKYAWFHTAAGKEFTGKLDKITGKRLGQVSSE